MRFLKAICVAASASATPVVRGCVDSTTWSLEVSDFEVGAGDPRVKRLSCADLVGANAKYCELTTSCDSTCDPACSAPPPSNEKNEKKSKNAKKAKTGGKAKKKKKKGKGGQGKEAKKKKKGKAAKKKKKKKKQSKKKDKGVAATPRPTPPLQTPVPSPAPMEREAVTASPTTSPTAPSPAPTTANPTRAPFAAVKTLSPTRAPFVAGPVCSKDEFFAKFDAGTAAAAFCQQCCPACVMRGPSHHGREVVDFSTSQDCVCYAGRLDGSTSGGKVTLTPGDDCAMVSGKSFEVNGGAGDDKIIAYASGEDDYEGVVNGGPGEDLIDVWRSGDPEFAAQNPVANGDDGDDEIRAHGSSLRVDGGTGDDVILTYPAKGAAESKHNLVLGGEGDDALTLSNIFESNVQAGGGADVVVVVGSENPQVDAGAGDDQVTIRGQYNDVYGGDGTDHLAIFLPGGAIDERAGKIEGFESQEVGLDDAAGFNKGEGDFAPAA